MKKPLKITIFVTLFLMTLNILFPPRVTVNPRSTVPGRGFLLKDVNSYKSGSHSRRYCKIDSEYLLVSNIFLVLFALTVYTGTTLNKEEEEAKSNSIDECHDTSVV